MQGVVVSMMCVLPTMLAYRDDSTIEGSSLEALGDGEEAKTNSSRSWDDIVVKATNCYKKVDVLVNAPLVENSEYLLSAWSLTTAVQTVNPLIGIAKDGMAVRSRINEQSELAGRELLASVEAELEEVFSFETSWTAIKNAASVQRQFLESSLDKAHPPLSKEECDMRFNKAKLGNLFCNVACGGSVDAQVDTSECKRSLQPDPQANCFESQAQALKDRSCSGWDLILRGSRKDDAARLRDWSRYVSVAVAEANQLLVKGFPAPYSLAVDSQQELVTWSKEAYDVCVADSKWYNNPIGALAVRASGFWHQATSTGGNQSESAPRVGEVIEKKAKQIKSFIHSATCPVVKAVISEASSYPVPQDFLDVVLLEAFQLQYLEDLESFKQTIQPVCEDADAPFVSLSTRLLNLGFNASTVAMSGIPAGLAAAAIMWQGGGHGAESVVLIMGALRSASYFAKRAADGYVTGSESCQRIADKALGDRKSVV